MKHPVPAFSHRPLIDRRRPAAVAFVAIALGVLGRAEGAWVDEWPTWRGPTGNGVGPSALPPAEWSEEKNIRWKVEVPGSGSASPVVWGNRIFVATAVPTGRDAEGSATPAAAREDGTPVEVQRFVLLCIDRATGKTVWERTAAETVPAEGHHPDHGFASASPMTDGEHVWAHFGTRGLFCYTVDGDPVWKKTDFGPMTTRSGFGEGSSPTLHGDVIVVPWDHEGPSYIAAIDKRTGRELWKTERDEPTSWGTPLVVEHDGRKQVVVTGENFARGYDLESGGEIWRCSGQTSRPVASPVHGHGLVFVGSGFRGAYLGAFRLGATGDLKGSDAVVWTADADTPDIASLLLSGDRLYYLDGKSANITSRDAKSGKVHYARERLEGMGTVYASPVAAAGRVYVSARNGTVAVLKDGDSLEVLAMNKLGEGIDATPALVGREIIIRGTKHLYCIAEE